jgi:drug/metabolite transporter (DMT)-like permease
VRDSFAPVPEFGAPQWIAVGFLGVFGGAITFFLWAFALERTSPTSVAISVTINPVSASLVGAMLLHEPIRLNLIVGIGAVFMGIWVATSQGRG